MSPSSSTVAVPITDGIDPTILLVVMALTVFSVSLYCTVKWSWQSWRARGR